MSEFTPPPLPGKKAMIAMAAVLAILVGFAIFLVLAVVLKDSPLDKERKMLAQQQSQQDQTSALDQYKKDGKSAEQQQEEFKKQQQQAVNNIKEDLGDSKYSKQLVRVTKNAEDEESYLNMRRWGFWHVVLPLFIAVAIFLVWVCKRHKDWIK